MSAWRATTGRKPPAAGPAVPAGRLPVLGAVGDLPPADHRLVVELDAPGRILVDGQPLGFGDLQFLLLRRADGSRAEWMPAPTRLDVVLRVDRDRPWRDALRMMEACADPRVRAYRLWFAALPEGGGEEGALALFLPGQPCLEEDLPVPAARKAVPVAVRIDGGGPAGTPLSGDLASSFRAAWRDLGWGMDRLQVSLASAPGVPTGTALRVVEGALRGGADSVVFRRPPEPGAEATPEPPWGVTVSGIPLPGRPAGGATAPAPGRLSGRFAGQTRSPEVVFLEEAVLEEDPGEDPPTAIAHTGPPPPMLAARRRRGEALRAGGGEGTEEAVAAALDWLARHQAENGSWEAEDFGKQCKIQRCEGAGSVRFSTGVTGLALLAFLGHGTTHRSPLHGARVRSALKYLKGIQDTEGRFGSSLASHQRGLPFAETDHGTVNHALATAAMAEAYGMTRSPLFRASAQAGIDFAQACRNPYLGWRYGIQPQDNDTNETAWMTLALAAGREAGLDVDPEAFDGAVAWMEQVTEPETGRTGYSARGNGPSRRQEWMDRYPGDAVETPTAMALLVRLLSGEASGAPAITRGADLCSAKPPRWDGAEGATEFCYWHFGTQAMFRLGGERWAAWNGAVKEALLAHRRTDPSDDRFGSWDPDDPWGPEGGRVYATALNALTLETYYRCLQTEGR